MTQATIVVPSRGGAGRLPVLFASLARQSLTDIEMIVVLDGDIDASRAVVDHAGIDLPVRVIEFPENRGRSAALNAGFGAADGEVLIRADDDLELEADFAEHHVELQHARPGGVIAMCRDVFPDTPYARAYGIQADENIRAAAAATPPGDTWRWWSGNVSTTKDDYLAVGEYDETFRAYGWEDIDWGYRLNLLGRPIVIAPGFETLHHGPVTTVVERAQRAFHSGAARLKFESKHGPAVLEDDSKAGGPWDRLVSTVATAGTERTITRAGRLLDRVVDRVPPRLAEKSVALLVQSASLAGRRYPQRLNTHL